MRVKNKNKGSSLIVTMLVLAIVLIATLSIALITTRERQASIGSVKSNKAYQLADEGLEKVMQLIIYGNINYINKSGKDNLYANLGIIDAKCEGGVIVDKAGNYSVELFDRSDPRVKIACDDPDRTVLDVDVIKAIGYDGNNSRAVSAPVSFLESGLIAYWRMNEGEGDVAYDWTRGGGENIGKLSSGASFIDGSTDAYSVDIPDGEYVSVDGLLVDDTADLESVTLVAWAKTIATGINGGEVISLFNNVGIRLNSLTTGDTIGFYRKDTNSSADWNFVSSGKVINDEDWHHFVFVADPLNSREEFYVDGVLEGEETFTEDIVFDNPDKAETTLGRASPEIANDDSWNLTGELREVRVYNRPLTEDEVLRLYNVSKP